MTDFSSLNDLLNCNTSNHWSDICGTELLLPVNDDFIQAIHSPIHFNKSCSIINECTATIEGLCKDMFHFEADFYERLPFLMDFIMKQSKINQNEKAMSIVSLANQYISSIKLSKSSKQKYTLESHSTDVFIGPLCSPLTVVDIDTILHTKKSTEPISTDSSLFTDSYFVCEKSDGIRSINVQLFEPFFPIWTYNYEVIPLILCLQLEKELFSIIESHDDLPTRFKTERSCSLECKELITIQNNTYTLTFIKKEWRSDSIYPIFIFNLQSNEKFYTLKRTIDPDKGRYFSYFYDRSMTNIFLSLSEPITSLNKERVLHAILDGEMIKNIHGDKYTFAVFDIIHYSILSFADTSYAGFNVVQNYVHAKSMSERAKYYHLYIHQFKPIQESLPIFGFITRLSFYPKELYPLSELDHIIDKITLIKESSNSIDSSTKVNSPYHTKYIYNQLHYNDGLIFTSNHFQIVPGSSSHQFKWKWPDKLTVDFLLRKKNISNTGCNLYIVNMFFKKKRLHNEFIEGTTFYKIIPMKSFVKIDFPKDPIHDSTDTQNSGVVAECFYNKDTKQWEIVKQRRDKIYPNSVFTIVSILESIAQDLTIEKLFKYFTKKVIPRHIQFDSKTNMTNSITNFAIKKSISCVFILKASYDDDNSISLKLQFLVQLNFNKKDPKIKKIHPIVCPHVTVKKHCYYDSSIEKAESINSQDYIHIKELFAQYYKANLSDINNKLIKLEDTLLENILSIQLANNGGTYAWSDTTVIANYNPCANKWLITHVSKQPTRNLSYYKDNKSYRSTKNNAHATQIMNHLMYLIDNKHRDALYQASIRDFPYSDNVFSNQHYSKKTNELGSLPDITRSEIRRINNFIKTYILYFSIAYLKSTSPQSFISKNEPLREDKLISILDLCSGRGGDLSKYKHYLKDISFILSIDSCIDAVAHAARRYSASKGLSLAIQPGQFKNSILTRFSVADCFSSELSQFFLSTMSGIFTHPDINPVVSCTPQGAHTISPDSSYNDYKVSLVVCQFALQYAFSSRQMVRDTIRNISAFLLPGGLFVATVPDPAWLKSAKERIRAGQDQFCEKVALNDLNSIKSAKERIEPGQDQFCKKVAPNDLDSIKSAKERIRAGVYESTHFSVAFPALGHAGVAPPSTFGEAYKVQYDTTVCEYEFIVDEDYLDAVAMEFGLAPLYQATFTDLLQEIKRMPDAPQLLKKFFPYEPTSDAHYQDILSSDLTQDLQEALSLYKVIVYSKMT